MIAQVLGYRRPERVRSLGLIMTGSGKRITSLPRLRALGVLLSQPPRDRDRYVDAVGKLFKVIGSPDYPPDGAGCGRWSPPASTAATTAGAARQLHAITASGDRSRRLRGVGAPTVVVHGTRDRSSGRPPAGRWPRRFRARGW